jgi:hypothetical protein
MELFTYRQPLRQRLLQFLSALLHSELVSRIASRRHRSGSTIFATDLATLDFHMHFIAFSTISQLISPIIAARLFPIHNESFCKTSSELRIACSLSVSRISPCASLCRSPRAATVNTRDVTASACQQGTAIELQWRHMYSTTGQSRRKRDRYSCDKPDKALSFDIDIHQEKSGSSVAALV